MKNMASLVRKGIQSRISGNGLFSYRNHFQHQLPLMPLSISFSISITIRHNSYTPSPPLFSPLRILDSKRYLDETARKISCRMDKERVKRILDAIGNREVDMNADYGNGIQEFKGKDNGFVLSIKRACVGIHLHRDDETFGVFQIRSEFLDDSNEGELEALCLCYILARVLGLKLRCVRVNNKSNLSFVNSWNWQDRLLFKSQAYKVLLPIIIELKGSSSIQHVPRVLNIIADASATHGVELLNRKDDKTGYLYKSGDVERPEVYIYVSSPDDLPPSHYRAFLAYRNIMNGDVEQYLKDMAEKKKTLRKEEKKRQKEEKKRQREEEKKRLREEKKRQGEEEEKNRLKEEKEEEKNRLKEEAKKSQEEVGTKILKEVEEGKGQEEEEEEK